MKCRKCPDTASVHMRDHRLALCRAHYIEWVLKQVQETIDTYSMFQRNQRILVCVSGGKDSLSLWEILSRLGYMTEGLYIDLGIKEGDYSSDSMRYAERFARDRGLSLHIINVSGECGFTVPEIAKKTSRGYRKVCSVCGLIKRYLMNRFSREHGFDVLATGHNLDDEVATLFSNTLNWSVGYLARQSPVLPESGGFTKKVKPLFRFSEKQIASFAFLNRIGYLLNDCPYSRGASSLYYKHLWNKIEDNSPGAKISFYIKFLKAKKEGVLIHSNKGDRLSPCLSCGQPTATPPLCSFCRLMERLNT